MISPMSWSRTLEWFAGAFALAALLLAGLLWLLGRSEDALKVAGVGLFLPGAIVMGFVSFLATREDRWFLRPGSLSLFCFAGGTALFALSTLAWLPFAPLSSGFGDMPPVILVTFGLGLGLASGGAVIGALTRIIEVWRAGHRRAAIIGFGFLIVTVATFILGWLSRE
jgi:hypothetical protein